MLLKREHIICVISAFLLFALLRFVIFDVQSVQGNSMLPTLAENCLVLSLRAPFAGTPRRGEVVTLCFEGETIVKRIAEIGPCAVVWNDASYHVSPDEGEEYANARAGRVHLPEGHAFLLGDNFASSEDSRSFGIRNCQALSGRVIAVLYPFHAFGAVR